MSAPRILVAGCGTGQHCISAASQFMDCHVTAVDLSLPSLGYAKRKSNEIGLDNLDYLQADILDLHLLKTQFDIIECGGVLHHMNDPAAGWNALVNLLHPGGLMKIGLYSELARSHVNKIREEIKLSGVQPNQTNIRNFRRELMTSKNEHFAAISGSHDFYSLSMIRDLIFHVQESHFTIPQISQYLDRLGLKFCGFESKAILNQFRKSVGVSADIYDLKLWAQFEEDNPFTFASMYQFWCQRI